MPGGDWYDSRYPRDVDTGNVAIPTSVTSIFATDGEIYEVNISNISSAVLTFYLADNVSGATSGNALLPTINIGANTTQLVLYQGDGLLAKGGASWQASSAGLVGSIRGRRTTGWVVSGGAGSGSQYCFSTAS